MSHSHSGEIISLESDKVSKIQLQYHSLPNKQNMTIKDMTAKAKSDAFHCGHSNITVASSSVSSSVRISHEFPRITLDFSSRTRTLSLEITCFMVMSSLSTQRWLFPLRCSYFLLSLTIIISVSDYVKRSSLHVWIHSRCAVNTSSCVSVNTWENVSCVYPLLCDSMSIKRRHPFGIYIAPRPPFTFHFSQIVDLLHSA